MRLNNCAPTSVQSGKCKEEPVSQRSAGLHYRFSSIWMRRALVPPCCQSCTAPNKDGSFLRKNHLTIVNQVASVQHACVGDLLSPRTIHTAQTADLPVCTSCTLKPASASCPDRFRER